MKKILIITSIILLLYSLITTVAVVNLSNKHVISDTVYIGADTVHKNITINKPVPYKVIVPSVDTVTIAVNDTSCISEYTKLYLQHYTKKTYIDTVMNDTSMTIIVTNYILGNNIDSTKVSAKNNRPTTIINNHVDENMFYKSDYTFGVGIYCGFKTFTPYISYKPKDNIEIYAGYDILGCRPQVGLNYRFYIR